jgi:hypothetical protein
MAYIGKQPVVGNFVKLDAITTSATATYNLLNGGVAYFPQSANNCIVSLNGVIQSPTSAYTISGSTIVFSDALTASDSIDFILVLGDVLNIGTPSDNTVSLAKLTATGTKDSTTFLRGDNTFASAQGKFESALLHVRDEKSSGTSGGGISSGSFVTRTLNTSVTNEISGASLSSNKITLPAGTYYIFAKVPAVEVNDHKAILYNDSDSSNTIIGTNEYAYQIGGAKSSFVSGRFTIASSKNFEIRHRVGTSNAGNGGGNSTSYSVTEVYTDVKIWKVA